MADTTRQMVVKMTMDAGNFKKTAAEISRQIKNIDTEIKAMGGDDKGKESKLEEKLKLQEQAVNNLKSAAEKARTELDKADTGAQKLMAAKNLSTLETQLETAEAKAKALKNQLEAANLLKFGTLATNFGRTMRTMGRNLTRYVTAPLAALGIGAYKTALDYESAAVTMQKTVDETDATKYEDIDAAFKSISENAPVAYTDLMNLAGSAGAMGVGADQIVKFVETVAMISETADDLDASSGAEALAYFLNITEQGDFSKISNVASAVTELGNNMVTTEGELLEMAQRMTATGELAGVSAQDVLALAAGFTSVGINAEAGGSAAAKLMKKFQLAAEVGTGAIETFSKTEWTAGMSIKEIQIAANQDVRWLKELAWQLGKTTTEVQTMINSGISLQQFSEVSGMSLESFAKSWDEDAGNTILAFFQGLNNLESSGGEETVLTKLNEMGLTEIRLSNLIASASTNPNLFLKAIQMSNEAYEENVALSEEAAKRYGTAESYQQMQFNKTQNAAADMGENLVDPFQDIMTKVSDLAKSFGDLSEEAQDRWIKVGAALVALGPVSSAIGTVATGVGKISTWAGKLTEKGVSLSGAFLSALHSPATPWVLVAAGLAGVAIALNNIKSPSEQIVEGLKNIKVELDEETYDKTTQALKDLQAQSDALSGKTGEYNKNISSAVKAGYGTADMYGTALGYEAAYTQKQISDIAGTYAEQIDELNGAIGAETDKAKQEQLAKQRDDLQAQWDTDVRAAKQSYMNQVSALVSGMLSGKPEAQAALEQAAKDYDLLALLEQSMSAVMDPEKDQAEIDAIWAKIFTPEVLGKYYSGQNVNDIIPLTEITLIREKLMQSLTDSLATVGSEDSFAYTLLQTILGNSLTSGVYDPTLTTGALDGLVELLDFKNAADSASDDWAEVLTPGLADPITDAIPSAKLNLQKLGATLSAEAATQAALISNAFNAGLNFNIPGVGGTGGVVGSSGSTVVNNNVTVNAGSSVAGTGIYGIQRGLTDALQRVNRGYGKT